MSFRFRKLYADVVGDDGTVCIVYVSWLVAWGLRARYAAVELYAPDGRREILRARRAPRLEPERVASDLRLHIDLAEGPFCLRFEPEAGPWAPAPADGMRGLRWSVLCARAQAVAVWPRGGREPLHGVGYADAVALDRAPRRLGLRRLEWGRVHLGDESVVFTRLSTRRGLAWGRAARWHRGAWEARETDVTLHPDPRGLAVSLADGGAAPTRLHLRPVRTLHDGPAFDAERIRSPLTRALAVRFAGRAAETRWLSRSARDGEERAPGTALHERVHF